MFAFFNVYPIYLSFYQITLFMCSLPSHILRFQFYEVHFIMLMISDFCLNSFNVLIMHMKSFLYCWAYRMLAWAYFEETI